MPYSIRKQKCKKSDGSSGSHTLNYTDKKGKKHSNCHSSKKSAQAQIGAIEAGPEEEHEDEMLREWVRSVILAEGMKSIDDLPDDAAVSLLSLGGEFVVEYIREADSTETPSIDLYGYVKANKRGRSCDGAFEVTNSKASKGWGPLLYDIAMEYATLKGGGLMADRSSVSIAAQKIWDQYWARAVNEGDIEMHEIEGDSNEVPCNMNMAKQIYGGSWEESPLAMRFTKQPIMIQRLRAAGKLIEE